MILLIVLYGVYNTYTKNGPQGVHEEESCEVCDLRYRKSQELKKELSMLHTPEYILEYIVDVIDHGSNTLGFEGGVMEGGYAVPEDAKKIACYVLELSGRKCPEPYPKDAAMFFTSICGGCHGNDGRGVGGKYPDLTRKKLLGIERKEDLLRRELARLEKQKHKE